MKLNVNNDNGGVEDKRKAMSHALFSARKVRK